MSEIEKTWNDLSAWVQELMADSKQFDCSHDFNHIERVINTAEHILAVESARPGAPKYDRDIVRFSALLHDVDDRKYTNDRAAMQDAARQNLLKAGASEQLTQAVQAVCAHVSYSNEAKHPETVQAMLQTHPELAIVQDADRLDAIGAIGVTRAFAYGAAASARGKGYRSLRGSLDHFDEKLLKIEQHMKTEEGRRLARGRTEKLEVFKKWFDSEEHGEWNSEGQRDG